MNKQIEAQEVPLIELLKRIPENARLIVDNADGMSSSYYPVGYLCHKAAQALAEAEEKEKHPQEIIKDYWDNFKEMP